jgi:GntR family transcriptional regulator
MAAWLRERILSGVLAGGDEAPSGPELARACGGKPGTAGKALRQLEAEGLLGKQGGQTKRRIVLGQRPVLYHFASLSESMRRRYGAPADAWMTDVKEQQFTPGYLEKHKIEIIAAGPDVARLLEISESALVVVRRRIRTVNGRRDNINDTYYDLEFVSREFPEILSPDDVPQGVVALMAERGYKQTRYRHELRWRLPTPEEAEKLDIPREGVAVLVQMNTGYAGDKPVKLTITTWAGSRHVLIYDVDA